jgi:hypothetical protein
MSLVKLELSKILGPISIAIHPASMHPTFLPLAHITLFECAELENPEALRGIFVILPDVGVPTPC